MLRSYQIALTPFKEKYVMYIYIILLSIQSFESDQYNSYFHPGYTYVTEFWKIIQTTY